MGRKLSYEEVKQYIEVESESGCKLLSESYNGNKIPLLFQYIKLIRIPYFEFDNIDNILKCLL